MTKIKIDPDDYTKILVIIDVKGEIKIPKDSKAIIVNMGLVGGKGLILDVTHNCPEDQCAQTGDFLQGEVRGMLGSMIPESELDLYLNKFKTGFQGIVDSMAGPGDGNAIINDSKRIISNLSAITDKLDQILSKTDKNIEASIANVEALTSSLKASDKKIESIIDNLDQITESLKNAHIDSLIIKGDNTVAGINQSLSGLKSILTKADSSLSSIDKIIAQIKKGDGSLGKLIKDDKLYDDLNMTVKHTNLLLQDIRLHPGRYLNISVLKGKGKKYEKVENDPGLN